MNVFRMPTAMIAVCAAVALSAQVPYQVADLNTGVPEYARSSNPGTFQAFGDTVFFNAADETTSGRELWKYTGGVASLVKDIAPGISSSSPGPLWELGGGVYLFRASDGTTGAELWRTDGTSAGTTFVKDIRPSGNSTIIFRASHNGKVFFSATDGVNGIEPWVSDGTEAGTRMLVNLDGASTSSNVTMMAVLGDRVLIFGANGMWASDGTTEGTTLVTTVGSAWVNARIGTTLYFTATGATTSDRELWRTDGTAAGTWRVADVTPGLTGGLSSTSTMATIGSTLYFNALRPGGGVDLWKSDGSAAGTQFIKTVSMNHTHLSLVVAGGQLLFEIEESIWRSDGTDAGTYVVDSSEAYNLVSAFGRGYYFRTTADQGTQLWSTNGTTTSFVAPAVEGLQLTSTGGKLYFSASAAMSAQEPWISEDGTAATTHLLANIAPDLPPSSYPKTLTAAGDLLYFRAKDGFTNDEIWRTNGTSAGTFRLTSLGDQYGNVPVNVMTGWRGALYFDRQGYELWRSDGTIAGTSAIKDFRDAEENTPEFSRLFAGSNYLFLDAPVNSTSSLWRSDGTTAGTIPLGDLLPYYQAPYKPRFFTELAGRVYLNAEYTGPAGLWVTDGSAASTRKFVSAPPEVIDQPVVAAAGAVFFIALTETAGQELWRTDGVGGGEMLVKDIAPGTTSSMPTLLTAAGRYLYFVANDGTHGAELWRTDGTTAGTILLGDIAAGGASSAPANLTAAGDLLYFTANDGSHGIELWRTDGTTAGTVMVADLQPGTAPSDPAALAFINGTLWFSANDGVAGHELWRLTNGVPAMVADLAAGTASSHPRELVQAGQRIYFSATTSSGRELWAMALTDATLSIGDSRLIEGTGGTRFARLIVARSGNVFTAASAAFTTVNGSAMSGEDYVAQSGTVTFPAGQYSSMIDVTVLSDAAIEPNEAFHVLLSSPSGATLSRSFGTAVIEDDDHRAELSIEPLPAVIYSDELRFLIINAGPSAATDLKVRLSESPGNLHFEMNYQCTSPDNPITCSLDTLPAGASMEVWFHPGTEGGGYSDTAAAPGSTITASVSALEVDSNPSNNITARMESWDGRITTPPFLSGFSTATATVTLDWPAPNDVTTTLTSSVPGVVITPASVIVPAGQLTAQYTITVGNYAGPVKLTATPASYGGSHMTMHVIGPLQIAKLDVVLSYDHQSAIYGEPIVLPVKVAAVRHSGTKPTGRVTLYDTNLNILQDKELALDGTTSFTIDGLQPGNTYYRLRYHGDFFFHPLQFGSVAVSVRGWPTQMSMDVPPLICAGTTTPIHFRVQNTANENAPTGSVKVNVGSTTYTLPLSPTGTPGLSRAILERQFAAGDFYLQAEYIPTGTFAQSWTGEHFMTQPCVPMNVVATGTSPTRAEVSWTPVPGADHYVVIRSVNQHNFVQAGTTSATSYVDDDLWIVHSSLYTVRAVDAAGNTIGWAAPDLAINMAFVDDPIVPGVTAVRGSHLHQIRAGATGMRYFGVNIGDVDDATPQTPPGTPLRAADLMELRADINNLRRRLGLPQFSFTDPTLTPGMPVKAVHITELRAQPSDEPIWSAAAAAAAFVCSSNAETYESGSCGCRTPNNQT